MSAAILVTGATGKTGRRLIPLLARRGVTARAASRSSVAARPGIEPVLPSTEVAMGDKSPHDAHHSQKSAKSIKEKRAERKAKEQMTESQMARLAAERKQRH